MSFIRVFVKKRTIGAQWQGGNGVDDYPTLVPLTRFARIGCVIFAVGWGGAI